jgi:four helix bundle protein
MYKFQNLRVYQMALGYVKGVYELSRRLPAQERFNLKSQFERAATSIVLNIAEGSTGQSDVEQGRFLGLALRSYLETVACLDLFEALRQEGHAMFVKLQAFRRALSASRSPVSRPRSPVP